MPHKVSLSRLKLTDFRNYAGLSLPLDGRHVVLTGQNGAGKTNLMEAVSFLSPGRGLRRAAYGDVPRAGSEGGFSVFATLEGPGTAWLQSLPFSRLADRIYAASRAGGGKNAETGSLLGKVATGKFFGTN